MGYGDPCSYHHGCAIPTPNIDRLASEGVRFTDGYVTAPVCGPSRGGLLTGAYQQRFGNQGNNDYAYQIPGQHKTMPEALKAAARYHTGMVGKWNMPRRAEHVFDEMDDVMVWAGEYWPIEGEDYVGVDGVNPMAVTGLPHWGPARPGDEYLTDRLTRKAVEFIQRNRWKDFFLYLAYNGPHDPWQAKQVHNVQYSYVQPEPKRIYAGMVAAIDEGIGRVLSTLDQYGLDGGKTLIAFLSDNGPDFGRRGQHGWEAHWPSHIMMGDPGPFSGSKNQFWEGGSRIPFILRWPGEIAAGSIYRQQVMSFDLLPTFIAAAHGRMPAGTDSDGVDLLPYVRGYSGGSPHDILFWKGEKQGAARMGDWKYLRGYPPGSHQLFNLKTDIKELRDVSHANGAIFSELTSRWKAWCMTLPRSHSGASPAGDCN